MSTSSNVPSYSTGLNELRANLQSALPSDMLEMFDTDAKALLETYSDSLMLKKGDKAPEFTLPNALNNQVDLSKLLQNGKVVLIFYRGGWCPYCNLQLAQYQQILGEIKAKGAQLVAISPQTPDASLDVAQKNELQFEVLSDVGNKVAKQYTTVFKMGEKPSAAMKELGIDMGAFYEDDSNEIPVPAVFIIEKDGTISSAVTMEGDYRYRVEPADILNVI